MKIKINTKLIIKISFALLLFLIIKAFSSKKNEIKNNIGNKIDIEKYSVNYPTFKNIFKYLMNNRMTISIFLFIISSILVVYHFKSIHNKQPQDNQNINKQIENYPHYETIEAIFGESDQNYPIRKKIANVLSKKKGMFASTLGFLNSIRFMKTFLDLDRNFNTEHLSEDEKKESINLYNQLPEKIKTAITNIIKKEIYHQK